MAEHHDSKAHVDPIRDYLVVWLALLAALVVTVWAAMFDFGALSVPIAMGIAVVKAGAVIMIFMGMRHSTRLMQVWACIALIFLFTMFFMFLGDYFSNALSSKTEPPRLEGPHGCEPSNSSSRK